MKIRYKTILIYTFMSLFFFGETLQAFAQDKIEKDVVAILNFNVDSINSDIKIEQARTLTAKFQSSISKVNIYELVSRLDVARVAEDQRDFNDISIAATIANQLHANKVIVGEIGKIDEKYIITANLIDVQTIKIERSVSVSHSGDKKDLDLVMDELAIELTKEESNFWWYVTGGAAITAVVIYLLKPGPEKPLKSPPALPN